MKEDLQILMIKCLRRSVSFFICVHIVCACITLLQKWKIKKEIVYAEDIVLESGNKTFFLYFSKYIYEN